MNLVLSIRISFRILIYDFAIIYFDLYQDLDLGFWYYLRWLLSWSWFRILLLSSMIYIKILIYDFAIIYDDFYPNLDLGFCYYLLWFLSGSRFMILLLSYWFLSGSWFRIYILSTRISIRILIYHFCIIYDDFY